MNSRVKFVEVRFNSVAIVQTWYRVPFGDLFYMMVIVIVSNDLKESNETQ